MNNSGLVRSVESICDLDGNIKDLSALQWLTRDHVFERLPLQKLHYDERLVLPLVNLMNRADVGVVQTRGGAGFALKTFQSLRLAN